MKWLGVVALVLLQSACAHRAVRCEGRLLPINPAAAAAHEVRTTSPGAKP
jgi:hypothetical protein